MTRLFSPLALRGTTLANRIVVSPMCMYSAREGCASEWHYAHLGSLAISGAGLLCLEATAVVPEGRISPDDLGLWNDANEAALEPVLAMIRAVAPIKLAVQLAHAGRKASSAVPWAPARQVPPGEGGWHPVAPSAVPFNAEPAPRALATEELAGLREAFAAAGRRAARLGFDAIELHAAHGYLLHQFLSPLANQRSDGYGGSLAARMRFPLEVFEALRAAVPEHIPVGVRISATDWVEGVPSLRLEDSIVFAQELKKRGCDWIDVSSGGISLAQKIPLGAGYQVPLARAIRAATGMTTMAVGMITAPTQAEAILAQGDADLVALGRAFLDDPHWPWRAATELGARIQAPRQYLRARSGEAARIFG
jgi:2,4-dienoyl-CoA reductase-like NADH-dependent reductase (Old Yellow Enzyme family)